MATAAGWFAISLRLAFSLPKYRATWLIMVLGLGILLGATATDFFGDLSGRPDLLFSLKNLAYAVGGICLSLGMLGWSRLTIAGLGRLERMVTVDELTGVLNRRGLMQRLRDELSHAMRRDDRLAVMMVDINDLKQMNDRHGHLQGDSVLRAVAGSLLTVLRRQDDVIGRFGGDEFVCLVRGADAERAAYLVSSISAEFQRRAVDLPVGSGISIGAALYPEDGASVDELIDAADRRMYDCKNEKQVSSP